MATFDTHAIVTLLERAGIETVQAEALTDAFKSLHDTLDVHFISSLPVMPENAYTAWVDSKLVQMVWGRD